MLFLEEYYTTKVPLIRPQVRVYHFLNSGVYRICKKEGARPLFFVQGESAHHILGLNLGLKLTNKLLTTGQNEKPRAPSKSATAQRLGVGYMTSAGCTGDFTIVV